MSGEGIREWEERKKEGEKEMKESSNIILSLLYLSLQSPRGGGGDERDERENGDHGPLQHQSQMCRLFWKRLDAGAPIYSN
jgi:hypothetical protein